MSSDKMEDISVESAAAPVLKSHIVVIGQHDYILENVENILNRAGYSTRGFLVSEEAAEYIRMNQVDLIFMGGGVNPNDRISLRKMIAQDFPQVKYVEHFGGPATILPEIEEALKK
jgi:DNA-binding NtrC family response regulator